MSKQTPESAPKGAVSAMVQKPQQAAVKYIDRPELAETFADSIISTYYDGHNLRIELGITRFDQRKPNEPLSGRRYPACRLVLTAGAGAELISRLQQLATALAQAGKTQQAPASKPTARPVT